MNPTISLELAREEHSQRLAHFRQVRTRAAARQDRRPTENIGRPPDPQHVPARSTDLVDAANAH